LPSTTLQEEGAGVVYFFIPTFPSTGTLLHYHSHIVLGLNVLLKSIPPFPLKRFGKNGVWHQFHIFPSIRP